MTPMTPNTSTYDYLLKTATAIGDKVINDRLDYDQRRRLLKLEQMPTPIVSVAKSENSTQNGVPKWVIPTALVGALILFLIVRRKT